MICFPNAKINIGLNIIRKREDGFHDIESLMYPLRGIIFDAVEIIESKKTKMVISGIPVPGDAEDNLCLKAYNLISKDYSVPKIKIHLHKAIPIGAGLGGGSSDAAFFIRLLSEKFNLNISWGEMHHYARQLGSDCSFFMSNQPAFAEGKGDQLEFMQIDLSGYYIAVIYPDNHINTAKAYSGVTPKIPARSLENDLKKLPLKEWKKYIHNDFEDSVFPQFPELKKIKEKLYSLGAIYASMSGSGSALYGIFKKETKLNLPAGKAGKRFSGYSIWEGKLT